MCWDHNTYLQESNASGEKKTPRPINHPHKVSSSLHWFSLNYSLAAISSAWAVRKGNWGRWGGAGDGVPPASRFQVSAREGSGRTEMVEGLRGGRGRRECVCFNLLRRENFFSLHGWVFGLLCIVLGFSTAIWDRVLMFIKGRERLWFGGAREVPLPLLQPQDIFSGNFPLDLDFLLTR